MEKITLATREIGRKVSELSKQEFISMMIEDIATAKTAYRQWSDENAERMYINDFANFNRIREYNIQRIVDKSYNKYKREVNRLRWVDQEVAKLPTTYERQSCHYGEDLTYMDWDIEPSSMRSSCITLDDNIEERFNRIYEESKNNKYFNNCIGWNIVYEFRPHIEFLLSDELQNEWTADQSRLANDVARFYEGTQYWGD
jgi:hypothetical protein